jgi:DNA-binding NarL/FixJ family response regulator
MLKGYALRHVADILSMNKMTVKWHMMNIRAKYGVSCNFALVVLIKDQEIARLKGLHGVVKTKWKAETLPHGS